MMITFYFGPTDKSLFGIYHKPKSMKDRRKGIVLCYPMGQEYIRSHRALHQLAIKLSGTGFHVLRFDYYGCGDSFGYCQEGNLNQWTQDIQIAIQKLKSYEYVSNTCLCNLSTYNDLYSMQISMKYSSPSEDLILPTR